MKKSLTLIGMMGAGKSTLAERLSRNIDNYIAVDTDNLVEYHYNEFISDMFKNHGEQYFRDAESKMVEMVYTKDNIIVAAGGGAFQKPENREIIKNHSHVVYLKASPKTLFNRLQDKTNRPLLKDGFTQKDIEKLLQEREENYMLADSIVETDDKSLAQIESELLGILND